MSKKNNFQTAFDIILGIFFTGIVSTALGFLFSADYAPILNTFEVSRVKPDRLWFRILIFLSSSSLSTYGLFYYYAVIRKFRYDTYGGKWLFVLVAVIALLFFETAFEIYPTWILSVGLAGGGIYLKNLQIHRRLWYLKRTANLKSNEQKDVDKFIVQFRRWRNISGAYTLSLAGLGIIAWFVLSLGPPDNFQHIIIEIPLLSQTVSASSWILWMQVATNLVGGVLVLFFTISGLYYIGKRGQL